MSWVMGRPEGKVKAIRLDSMSMSSGPGWFCQLGGRPKVTSVLLEYSTRGHIPLTDYEKCCVIDAEDELIRYLDAGVEVCVDVDGKVF